jgi:cytochrome c553
VKRLGIVLWLLLAVTSVRADEVRNIELLASSCAACHGTRGNSNTEIPVIAGMDKELFKQKLTAFLTGEREATVMHQHAAGYLPTEIDILADYFSQQ